MMTSPFSEGWLARGRNRVLIAGSLSLVVGAACAVSVPPQGGPEDKAPPRIVETIPHSDSTGVDPNSTIRLRFSEPLHEERVERNVIVNPPIEIRRVHWEGTVLVIEPAQALVRDTTYVVRVKPDYQDRHNVPGAQTHEFAFATGTAPLDTARIVGKVSQKRGPAARAIVRGFRLNARDTLRVERDRADREATADRDGKFTLRHLPSNGARFVLLAFLDQNNNAFYDLDNEPGIIYPDTVTILPGHPVVEDIELVLLDPKEPGAVKGTVSNESGADTARVMVAMYEREDSTHATYRAVCDSTGAYEVKSVKPGEYVLRAFVDIKADSLPGSYPCATNPKGCAEPVVRRPGWLKVEAAKTVTEPALVIRKKENP
jgi:hypothetical protein